MDSFSPINPKLIDARQPGVGPHDGYPDELKAGDTPDVLREACGEASREFPQALYIDPSNWADAARDNDRYKTWPVNYIDRFTNQSPTHECTCHALRACAEAARNEEAEQ